MNNWLKITLTGLVGILLGPSYAVDAKAQVIKTVPKAYHGTWYGADAKNKRDLIYISNQYVITGTYAEYVQKTQKIKFNYEKGYVPKAKGAQKLVFKRVAKGYGQFGTTYTFNQGSDIDNQLPPFWLSKMKIDGHQQTVLKAYENFGKVHVYTKKPLHHDYSYLIKAQNIGSQIGK